MKVEITKPDTVQFCIQMEKGDTFYEQCMYARVTFNNKNWTMTATTDRGNYSYTWVPEDKRTFLQLMQQIDGLYLLSKVADRTSFDLESSKKCLIECLVHCEDAPEQLVEEVSKIVATTEYDFAETVKEDVEGIGDYNVWEFIERDYPNSAKVFSRVFVDCIQPEIRKYLLNQCEEGL